jgi:hypothetical protein
VALSAFGEASASPSLSLDDPIYEELARLRALRRVSFSDGLRPLTEWWTSQLLSNTDPVHDLVGTNVRGWWLSPVHRARARVALVADSARPYSTPIRPRDLAAGMLALSCERDEGRPCGHGLRLLTELEPAAGFGPWVSGWLRVHALASTTDNDITIAQTELSFETPAVAAVIGRSTFALGPAARTQTGWSTHAAPLDHVRLFMPRGLQLSERVAGRVTYVLGRMRAPQTLANTLVSIGRLEVSVGENLDIGGMQLLQLGGDGLPALSVVDFILEHFRRKDMSAGPTDSSNRRAGLDVAWRIPELQRVRLYYTVTFEDLRQARWIDAVRYDADHVFGAELAALGAEGRHALLVELQTIGIRSYEHQQRLTGFTNANFVTGAPLGPDSESVFAQARLRFNALTLSPWLELARVSSDRYQFVTNGPINRIAKGEDEARYRVGARARMFLQRNLWIDVEAMFEHVDDFGFQTGSSKNNGGLTATITWYPSGSLGRLALN